MLKFIKESREELRKVVWPTREEVLNSTIVVLWVTVIISIFLFLTDLAFHELFHTIINFFGTRS